MKGYIRGFDGLRCFSIVLVIITHLGVATYLAEGSYLRERVFYLFSGSAGVNLFFAISGFLITTLLLNELQKNGKIHLIYFFIRRFLRLLPPLIPFFIILFLFMKLGFVRETIFGLLASILYLFNFVPKAKLFWSAELGHTWSLAVEEQFYILLALFLHFFKDKFLLSVVIALLFVCAAFFYTMPFLQVVVNGTNYKLTEIFFVERWTIPAIGPILAGVLFALLHHGNHFQVQKRFTGPRAGFLPLFIFLSPLYLPDFLMPMVTLFHGLGAAMVLLWITRNQSHAFVNAMEWKPIKYVGTISYGLYIWQGFFLRTGPGVLPKIWVHDSPQNVLLAIVVSILSYELLEKKVLRWKSKFQPA